MQETTGVGIIIFNIPVSIESISYNVIRKMNKFYLSIAFMALVSVEAGRNVAQRELRFKGSKGKGSKSEGAAAPVKPFPSCPGTVVEMPSTKSSKSSKSSKSRSKGKGSVVDTCLTSSLPSAPLCESTFTGPVTLDSTFVCDLDGKTPKTSAITMEGPEAVLDCAGNEILQQDFNMRGTAITLKGGATAVNCFVGGFRYGVLMDGGE